MLSQLGLAAEKGGTPTPLLLQSKPVSYTVIAMILTQEILRELLDYDPDSGRLTWKPREREWFNNYRIYRSWNSRYAGSEAGSLSVNKRGYRRRILSIKKKRYKEHRIIWLYMTGSMPIGEIDHIDQDATNNKWPNLREVDRLGNNLNQSKKCNNRSGITGVSWRERENKWLARVVIRGEIVLNETFETKDDAAKAVKTARTVHGFAIGHGRERCYA